MAFNAIRPTTTQRVRGFLAAQGVEVKPWAPLDETYASLYRLMSAKRDEAEFWGPVQRLLGEIVEDATGANGRLPAPQAELLKGWDIEDLVRDLRRALPSETGADASAFRRFSAGLSAPVLGGFLLLGMAATGCDEGGDSRPAWAEDCSLDDSSGIYAAIEDSTELSSDDKAGLCGCFASLPQGWQQNLSDMFETCEPENLAWVLEDLVSMCESEQGTLADDPTAFYEDCGPTAAYKGVAFPS